MKTTKQIMSALGLTMLLISGVAHAEKTGNGGGAIVCRDADSHITYAGLYDLWEHGEEYVAPDTSGLSPLEQADQAVQRLAAHYPPFVREVSQNQHDIAEKIDAILKSGKKMAVERVFDSLHLVMPARCPNDPTKKPSFEQVVNYTDSGEFLMDSEIFLAMDARSQGALINHEATYKVLRINAKVTDSRTTRALVSSEFLGSDQELDNATNTILGKHSDDDGCKYVAICLNGKPVDSNGPPYSIGRMIDHELQQGLHAALESGNIENIHAALEKSIVIDGITYYADVSEENDVTFHAGMGTSIVGKVGTGIMAVMSLPFLLIDPFIRPSERNSSAIADMWNAGKFYYDKGPLSMSYLIHSFSLKSYMSPGPSPELVDQIAMEMIRSPSFRPEAKTTFSGLTPLIAAVLTGQTDAVAELLKNPGTEVNAQFGESGDTHRTALWFARHRTKNNEITRLLEKAGATE